MLTYVAVAAVQDKLLNGPFFLEVFFFFFLDEIIGGIW